MQKLMSYYRFDGERLDVYLSYTPMHSGTHMLQSIRYSTLFMLLIVIPGILFAVPPYNGTIFIDQNIILSSSPTSFESSTYVGQEVRTVYDRRSGWVDLNTFVYKIVWDDGLTTEALINPEHSQAEAAVEAEFYGIEVGRLPTCLRVDIDFLWIHKGVNPFGGGNRSLTIHTGQAVEYIQQGILEETLVHEASHTSLDEYYATESGWVAAQASDNEFISTYAQDNPSREDVAETFLLWYAARYKSDVISESDYTTITQTVPNRLAYFDALQCDLYPLVQESSSSTQESSSENTSVSSSSQVYSSNESSVGGSSSLLVEDQSSSEGTQLSSVVSSDSQSNSSSEMSSSSEDTSVNDDGFDSSAADNDISPLHFQPYTACMKSKCMVSLYSISGALIRSYTVPQGDPVIVEDEGASVFPVITTD